MNRLDVMRLYSLCASESFSRSSSILSDVVDVTEKECVVVPGESIAIDSGVLLGRLTGATSVLICARSFGNLEPSVFVEELSFKLSFIRVRLEIRLAAGCADGLAGGPRLLAWTKGGEFVSRTLRRLDASRLTLINGRFSGCYGMISALTAKHRIPVSYLILRPNRISVDADAFIPSFLMRRMVIYMSLRSVNQCTLDMK